MCSKEDKCKYCGGSLPFECCFMIPIGYVEGICPDCREKHKEDLATDCCRCGTRKYRTKGHDTRHGFMCFSCCQKEFPTPKFEQFRMPKINAKFSELKL